MLPQNNQIDIAQILKDFYIPENSLATNRIHTNNLFQTGLTQQQQQIISLLNCQQQSQQLQSPQSQELQERLNLYLHQQQLQIQQQQIQLSDLVALSAQLSAGNPALFNNALTQQSTPNQMNIEITQQPQGINHLNKQINLLTESNPISNAFNNTAQANTMSKTAQPSFNYSSSAQNMIFQNLQNQLTTPSSRSIIESFSEQNSQSNISIQKSNFSQNPNSNVSANNSDNAANSTINKSPSATQNSVNQPVKSINYNNTIQNPNGSNTGRWTREEHLRFVKGLGMYGKNWKKVEEYVGTRSGAQIRSHAQKFFNKIQRENAKSNSKSGNNGKNGNLQSEDSFPQMRKRQQSTQSNYSCDFASDDGEGENDLQNQNQLEEIVPQQSKQKDAKEWLHYYKLLQQTCQQNLEAQKQNKNLSEEQIQQQEEQLKKIQIFIQLLSACDNINQHIDCASPMSQGSPMASLLPFSFDNLNINSPLMNASPGQQQNLKPQDPHQIADINSFSLDSNQGDHTKFGQNLSKQSNFGLNSKQMHFGSLFKKYHEANSDFNDQQSNTSQNSVESKIEGKNESFSNNPCGIIQSKLKIDNQTKTQRESETQISNRQLSKSTDIQTNSRVSKISSNSVEESNLQDGEDEEEISEQATNRPNNLSNSAISSNNDQNSTFSTPENQKLANQGNGNQNNSNNSQNNYFNNFQFVGENIDIESDFSKIKNLSNQQQGENQNQKKQLSPKLIKKNSERHNIVVPIASPSLESKKTPFFSAQCTPIKGLNDNDSDSLSNSSHSSFKLEPSFFIFFMKKYGKYFLDSQQQSPKLSDLVNMNTQQYEQDCIIEDQSVERESSKSISQSSVTSSPIIKRRQATERAQNFMDLEEDYGSSEMPILRKKQSSFSAYSNQNKGLLSLYTNTDFNTNMISNEQAVSSPPINKYQCDLETTDDQKQLKIVNFRKKLKTADFTNNANFSLSLTQQQQHQ
ncbi:Myb-like DNA-binding domain, shaqkyf class protein (macronuclear) [Tetrahymena thermophila SB210]|uniref:Myb-like DNA-binding domain, shaqkyf class protein n=1 Tax=Tetrahymena thermophila (strain SB210) TaxID=312017 RepID=Q22FZ7_TETTS|nr:Myb-like DNA-binding domain, shaqkyf class protein [Tetrahymena thermophila SB210]EAR84229.2 Myb-like DNA-binding domain, shaqkyf class protein [Tetrahymena thermophila SB210]|eukprot:XP_001031892.2 Myb-like DNA-binding domain, shaqkyf class protein [Tetrahymena thermophila SB210]